MMISIVIASSAYMCFRAKYGADEFDVLARSLGGITIHLAKHTSMDIQWAHILFTLPIFMLLASPAVWLLHNKRNGPNIMSDNQNSTPLWLVVLSFCAVPVLFGFLASLEICRGVELRWQTITTFCLLSTPFFLVLLSRYIKKIKWGDNELETSDSSTSPKEYVENLSKGQKAPAPAAGAPSPALTSPAMKVIRTLWNFQLKLFGNTMDKRWGFILGSGHKDYFEYISGAHELISKALAAKDHRGMLFLTDQGIAYCKDNSVDISSDDMWTNFDN